MALETLKKLPSEGTQEGIFFDSQAMVSLKRFPPQEHSKGFVLMPKQWNP